jgi:hypothetical protein
LRELALDQQTVRLHCANDFIPPQFFNERGNIQVR